VLIDISQGNGNSVFDPGVLSPFFEAQFFKFALAGLGIRIISSVSRSFWHYAESQATSL
jgi:hypothetical protein